MESLRNWSWRLAILALPWQTRYILFSLPTPEAGYQTEWGIYAIYASWILIIIAWVFSLSRTAPRVVVPKSVWLILALLVLPIVLTHTTYSLQFLAQLIALVLLVDALRRNHVSRADASAWFLLSLVPHILLAVTQFDTQSISANKWLGISAQNPIESGVSVIGDSRVLRAYAGFSHPNIAGMWFALGLGASLWLLRRSEIRWQIILAWLMCAALPIGIVLTFSRSAWLTTFVIVALFLAKILRRPIDVYALRSIILVILCTLIGIIPVLPLVMSRANTVPSIENQSLEERSATWKNIWPVIGQSPIIGHGLGSSAKIMSINGLGNQPPHALPLVVLLEVGLMGLCVLGITLLLLWRAGDTITRCLLIALSIPALTDHYLWSLWSGQILATFCMIWFFLIRRSIDKKIKY